MTRSTTRPESGRGFGRLVPYSFVPYGLIAVGGGLGALARFVLVALLEPSLGGLVPTLVIDVAGGLLAGVLFGYVHGTAGPRVPPIDSKIVPLAITGFCGGFTTFSGFGLLVAETFREGAWLAAGLGISVALAGVLAAARFGQYLGVRASPRG